MKVDGGKSGLLTSRLHVMPCDFGAGVSGPCGFGGFLLGSDVVRFSWLQAFVVTSFP